MAGNGGGIVDDGFLDVAKLGRPHGLRGALSVRPFNPDTELLTPGRLVRLRSSDGDPVETSVVAARRAGDRWIVRFAGYDDRDAVRPLVNRLLAVPVAEARTCTLPAGVLVQEGKAWVPSGMVAPRKVEA